MLSVVISTQGIHKNTQDNNTAQQRGIASV